MLGVDAPVSLLVVREILVQALLAVVLAFAVYPLVRRALGAALIDYQPSSRPARAGADAPPRRRAAAVEPRARRARDAATGAPRSTEASS